MRALFPQTTPRSPPPALPGGGTTSAIRQLVGDARRRLAERGTSSPSKRALAGALFVQRTVPNGRSAARRCPAPACRWRQRVACVLMGQLRCAPQHAQGSNAVESPPPTAACPLSAPRPRPTRLWDQLRGPRSPEINTNGTPLRPPRAAERPASHGACAAADGAALSPPLVRAHPPACPAASRSIPCVRTYEVGCACARHADGFDSARVRCTGVFGRSSARVPRLGDGGVGAEQVVADAALPHGGGRRVQPVLGQLQREQRAAALLHRLARRLHAPDRVLQTRPQPAQLRACAGGDCGFRDTAAARALARSPSPTPP